MADLLDLVQPDGEDNDPGVKSTIFIASEAAFVPNTGLKGVKKTTLPGDSVTIDGSHEFPVGKGFSQVYATQDSAELKLEPSGERDGRGQKGTIEFFHPGSKKAAAEFARRAKNMSNILIVEFPDGQRIQLGSKGRGVEVVGSFSSGKDSSGRKGWIFKGEFYTNSILYYEGTITLADGEILPAYPGV